MQSKRDSFIESATNVSIWYITALISQILIFPLFKINVTFSENMLIWLYFTFISLARSYIVRRYFNNKI